jgi:hypothetical protein
MEVVFCDVSPGTTHPDRPDSDAHILYQNNSHLNLPSFAWRFLEQSARQRQWRETDDSGLRRQLTGCSRLSLNSRDKPSKKNRPAFKGGGLLLHYHDLKKK